MVWSTVSSSFRFCWKQLLHWLNLPLPGSQPVQGVYEGCPAEAWLWANCAIRIQKECSTAKVVIRLIYIYCSTRFEIPRTGLTPWGLSMQWEMDKESWTWWGIPGSQEWAGLVTSRLRIRSCDKGLWMKRRSRDILHGVDNPEARQDGIPTGWLAQMTLSTLYCIIKWTQF